MTETGHQPYTQRGDWWSRRPRRSRSDSKIAGVAGGLGHYLGVDPLLFRVGFAALTIVGGAGILLYCLLWLLLPAEGDEVSAGESLIGRGRSSVSPVLAVGLAIAIMITVLSSFSWGMPFWPALVIGMIAFHIARKQRRGPFRPGSDWDHRLRNTTQSFTSNQWQTQGGQRQGGQAEGTGHRSGWAGQNRPGGWGGPAWGPGSWGNWGCGSHGRSGWAGQTGPANQPAGFQGPDDAPSPFDTPAFWDGPEGPPSAAGPATSAPSGFTKTAPSTPGTAGPGGTPGGDFGGRTPTPFPDLTKRPADSGGTGPNVGTGPIGGSQPTDFGPDSAFPQARTTPPAWDPLGAAPFAWDLPDIELAPQTGSTLVKSRSASPVIARATIGTAAIVVAAQVIGIIAGWWTMSWAAIAGVALGIVAVGLLVQALRGRSMTLLAPGVLLCVATVGLALTGLSGTASVGQRTWAPPTSSLAPAYSLSTGDAFLDLSRIEVAPGKTVTTSLEVNAGQAEVTLPADVNVKVSCSANAGDVDCVGNTDDGLRVNQSFEDTSIESAGTLVIDVHVGTGQVRVTR